jgi:chromosomal replication initiation ATPase DnaA
MSDQTINGACRNPGDDDWVARPKPLPMIPKAAEMLPAVPRRGATTEAILACVSLAFDVPMGALLSRDRHKVVAEARGVAYWLLRTINGLSYPEIGRATWRDHTTAMSAIRKVLRRREEEREFEAFTDALSAAIVARIGTPTEEKA